jgi:hypothetical protein
VTPDCYLCNGFLAEGLHGAGEDEHISTEYNFNNFSKDQQLGADRDSDASATKGVLGLRRVRAFELEDYLCKQE